MTPYSISLPLENSVNITSSMTGDEAKLLIRKVQSGVLINTIIVKYAGYLSLGLKIESNLIQTPLGLLYIRVQILHASKRSASKRRS
jgi:hypothetical protein